MMDVAVYSQYGYIVKHMLSYDIIIKLVWFIFPAGYYSYLTHVLTVRFTRVVISKYVLIASYKSTKCPQKLKLQRNHLHETNKS